MNTTNGWPAVHVRIPGTFWCSLVVAVHCEGFWQFHESRHSARIVYRGWITWCAVTCAGLGNNTQEGWRRGGWWTTNGVAWQYGVCPPRYNRTCVRPAYFNKTRDMRTGIVNGIVDDPDLAFRPAEIFNEYTVVAQGRWSEVGGECIDYVLDGCFNNGTCVAPDTVSRALAVCACLRCSCEGCVRSASFFLRAAPLRLCM
jgi:hypothetical protein